MIPYIGGVMMRDITIDKPPPPGTRCVIRAATGAYNTCVADKEAVKGLFRVSGVYKKATHWLEITERE